MVTKLGRTISFREARVARYIPQISKRHHQGVRDDIMQFLHKTFDLSCRLVHSSVGHRGDAQMLEVYLGGVFREFRASNMQKRVCGLAYWWESTPSTATKFRCPNVGVPVAQYVPDSLH